MSADVTAELRRRRRLGWIVVVRGLLAIAFGELLPLAPISRDAGLELTCLLFVIAVGPICIIAGAVVLIRTLRRN